MLNGIQLSAVVLFYGISGAVCTFLGPLLAT